MEVKCQMDLLDRGLTQHRYLSGNQYTIADIAIFPWVRNLIGFYGAGDMVGIDDFPNVKRVLDAFVARPAVQKGLNIPPRD